MPDIPNRDELESEYAKEVSKLLKTLAGRLLEAMGDPPDLSNLDQAFWDEQTKEALAVLIPFGERIFMQAARRLLLEQPVGVEWDVIHEAAVDWASAYSFSYVSNLRANTMRFLQKVISRYFTEGMTIGQLESTLLRHFDPVRAEMIAVTEVTRAAAQGELAVLKELQAMGYQMEVRWNTNHDELVCPICRPLNQKKQGDSWNEPPPAHPRCRCWLNITLSRAG